MKMSRQYCWSGTDRLKSNWSEIILFQRHFVHKKTSNGFAWDRSRTTKVWGRHGTALNTEINLHYSLYILYSHSFVTLGGKNVYCHWKRQSVNAVWGNNWCFLLERREHTNTHTHTHTHTHTTYIHTYIHTRTHTHTHSVWTKCTFLWVKPGGAYTDHQAWKGKWTEMSFSILVIGDVTSHRIIFYAEGGGIGSVTRNLALSHRNPSISWLNQFFLVKIRIQL